MMSKENFIRTRGRRKPKNNSFHFRGVLYRSAREADAAIYQYNLERDAAIKKHQREKNSHLIRRLNSCNRYNNCIEYKKQNCLSTSSTSSTNKSI